MQIYGSFSNRCLNAHRKIRSLASHHTTEVVADLFIDRNTPIVELRHASLPVSEKQLPRENEEEKAYLL